jgi:Flp pilus assembly protein TadB
MLRRATIFSFCLLLILRRRRFRQGRENIAYSLLPSLHSLHSSRRPTDTGNPGVEKSSLKVSSLICGLLILADVLAAAVHARFTLLFALVQALLLYYLYLYTPPGGRQTRAIRELKSLP